MAKKNSKKAAEKPAGKSRQNLFMSTPAQREAWNRAARTQGRSFSSWVCVVLDEAVKNQLGEKG